MSVKKNFGYRLSLMLAPLIYRMVSRTLFATCRLSFGGYENIRRLEEQGRSFIAAFWHYSIFYTLHYSRFRSWAAMVSASRDGEYIARIMQGMGVQPVRGSRSKRGLAALKEMEKYIGQGMNGAIVADGSQGPPLIVQAGVILLASRSGAPILPTAWGADRYITFGSWDRTVLPKPFAKIHMCMGEPLEVPPKLKSGDIEKYRLELEKRLNDLYRQAWAHFSKERH